MRTISAAALLRLYPRRWQRRYGDEMRELLAAQRLSLRTLADLIAGAIDARLNPQLTPVREASTNEGERHMTSVFSCAKSGLSVADQWRSAAWMIGGSLIMVLTSTALQMRVGPNSFSEAVLLGAFPASLMLSFECTYFKRYSPAARRIMSLGGAALIILIMWASTAIGNRI